MIIQTSYVNATEHHRIGDESIALEDSVLADMTWGEMFKWFRGQHGRCIGKVYIGDGIPVGWVFLQRARYEDVAETYLRETWVAMVAKDETTRVVEYQPLDGKGPEGERCTSR